MSVKNPPNYPYDWSAVNKTVGQYIGAKSGYAMELANTQNSKQWQLKRPSWFPNVRKKFYKDAGFKQVSINGCKGVIGWCPTCKTMVTPHCMQLDHESDWKSYIKMWDQKKSPIFSSLTYLEARILYNCPMNLRLICCICNGKHPEQRPPSLNTKGNFNKMVIEQLEYLVGQIEL